jgi:hypothetical protein
MRGKEATDRYGKERRMPLAVNTRAVVGAEGAFRVARDRVYSTQSGNKQAACAEYLYITGKRAPGGGRIGKHNSGEKGPKAVRQYTGGVHAA